MFKFFLGALVISVLLSLLFFKVIDITLYLANKLGDLLFGKENKMAKVEFIPKHEYPICFKCRGNGCDVCENGKFREEFYHLIYTDKNGQKMAFGVDGLK